MLFELYDEDTAGMRPAPLSEPWPQDGLVRHLSKDMDYTPLVQVLDVPMPQQTDLVPSMFIPVEHVGLLVSPQRGLQRSGVGALLVSGLLEGLEQLVPQERTQPRPVERVHGSGETALLLQVQARTDVADDVYVPLESGSGCFLEPIDDVPVHLRPHGSCAFGEWRAVEQVVDVPVQLRVLSLFAAVSGRNVEQVVDAPVPQRALSSSATVSGRIVEQVVNAPGLCADFHARSAAGSSTSWSAAASLKAPQERFQGVFRTFPRGKKSAKVTRESSAPLGAHSSPSTWPAYGDDDQQFWTAPDNRVWKRIYDPQYEQFYWNIIGTSHVQWEPPWQSWGTSDSDA